MFTEECNKIIQRNVELFPNKFVGICGLPQVAGDHPSPGLGERYWYPLYEKLCKLDLPAHIHAIGSRQDRKPYSLHFINEETTTVYNLVKSDVFTDPRSQDRRQPWRRRDPTKSPGLLPATSIRAAIFRKNFRNLYFDTALDMKGALRLLIETAGVEHCCSAPNAQGSARRLSDNCSKQAAEEGVEGAD